MNTEKIVIIGNGESVLNNQFGSLIDKFDNVARINNYRINGYQNFIGEKTTIWFNGANQRLNKRKITSETVIVFIPSIIQKKKDNYEQVVASRLGMDNSRYELLSASKICEYEQKCNSNRLTTGTYSIFWSMENFKDVYLYGFDFFIDSKSHYFDNKIISTIKNKGILPKAEKHDMNKEKLYVENLIDEGKLKNLNG